jgi:hypothetical protein
MAVDTPSSEPKGDGKGFDWLEGAVGLSVVLLATFLGICNVKDGNVVQKMQEAQARQINQWGYYQARNIREGLYDATSDVLRAQSHAGAANAAERAERDKLIDESFKKILEERKKVKELPRDDIYKDDKMVEKLAGYYRSEAVNQTQKKAEPEEEAKKAAKEYKALGEIDDFFDICEAALALALAMMGVTALVKKWWLFAMALVPAAFGVFMGVAGFAGLEVPLHEMPVIGRIIEWIL